LRCSADTDAATLRRAGHHPISISAGRPSDFSGIRDSQGILDFGPDQWLVFFVKTKTRHSVSPRAKARNGRRVSTSSLPRFRDVLKSLSGIMEGPPDLSSREGFGPTKISR
jgi:hypothetical protein